MCRWRGETDGTLFDVFGSYLMEDCSVICLIGVFGEGIMGNLEGVIFRY